MTAERLADLVARLRKWDRDWRPAHARTASHYAAVADLVEATAARHAMYEGSTPSCEHCEEYGWPCPDVRALAPLADLLLGPEHATVESQGSGL